MALEVGVAEGDAEPDAIPAGDDAADAGSACVVGTGANVGAGADDAVCVLDAVERASSLEPRSAANEMTATTTTTAATAPSVRLLERIGTSGGATSVPTFVELDEASRRPSPNTGRAPPASEKSTARSGVAPLPEPVLGAGFGIEPGEEVLALPTPDGAAS